jgi:hypothetical protein
MALDKLRKSSLVDIYTVHKGKTTKVGYVDGDTYYRRFVTHLHMLQKPPAMAISKDVIAKLESLKVKQITFWDETMQSYKVSFAVFKEKGIPINRGHGDQTALPVQYWKIN